MFRILFISLYLFWTLGHCYKLLPCWKNLKVDIILCGTHTSDICINPCKLVVRNCHTYVNKLIALSYAYTCDLLIGHPKSTSYLPTSLLLSPLSPPISYIITSPNPCKISIICFWLNPPNGLLLSKSSIIFKITQSVKVSLLYKITSTSVKIII